MYVSVDVFGCFVLVAYTRLIWYGLQVLDTIFLQPKTASLSVVFGFTVMALPEEMANGNKSVVAGIVPDILQLLARPLDQDSPFTNEKNVQ